MTFSPVMLDLLGLELGSEEKELLQHPQVGGVILFARNYHSLDQLANLVGQIRAATPDYLLIAVDQEGGRIQRFREGFTALPAAAELGYYYDRDSQHALQVAEKTGWLMAIELLTMGIDLSFAPVVDVDGGVSEVIGNRSFHHNPTVVADLAGAYIRGMQNAGMAATAKHFPGHGSVREDSHHAVPIDPRDFEQVYQQDMQPFVQLIKQGLTAVMPAHIIYSQIASQPVGFSSYWLQEILRKKLGFTGVIFSDDLTMAGASIMGDFTQRAQLALLAGCDKVLVCNHREGVIEVLESLEKFTPLQVGGAIGKMRGYTTYARHALSDLSLWQEAVQALEIIKRVDYA